jgi:hypothetical protein
LRGNAHQPQSFNLFAYVQGNPMNYTDPFGLDKKETIQVIGTDPCPEVPQGWSCGGWYAWVWQRNPLNWLLYVSWYGGSGGGTGPGKGPQQPLIPCSAVPVSGGLGQYLSGVGSAEQMLFEFATGLGPSDLAYGPNSVESQMMASSPGVTQAVNDYLSKGKPSGGYYFGLMGLVSAGINPIRQFVGSYTYNVTPTTGGLNVTLSNYTSFKSGTYHLGPSWDRSSFGPGGTTRQTYQVFVPCNG